MLDIRMTFYETRDTLNTHQITSFELVYDGKTIYKSGGIKPN